MCIFQYSFIILLGLCQPFGLNCESYKKMHDKSLSSNFSSMHLLRVYESLLNKFECLIQCNIMNDCQTVKVEHNNEKVKCSVFDLIPNNNHILEYPNDSDLYLKLIRIAGRYVFSLLKK